MKKLFIITITLCMVFVLTACSTKKNENNGGTPTNNTEKQDTPKVDTKVLNCSKDYSSQMTNNVSMVQDVEVTFVDNKIETMIMNMKFELPSSLASSSDTFVNTMKTTYDEKYGKYEGVKVTLEKTSSTKFNVLITMDFKKISATDKKTLGMSGSEDYTVNKTSFINSGYTCN